MDWQLCKCCKRIKKSELRSLAYLSISEISPNVWILAFLQILVFARFWVVFVGFISLYAFFVVFVVSCGFCRAVFIEVIYKPSSKSAR